jgi:hypothetical protein
MPKRPNRYYQRFIDDSISLDAGGQIGLHAGDSDAAENPLRRRRVAPLPESLCRLWSRPQCLQMIAAS